MIRIATDTGANLPQDIIDELRIVIISGTMDFGTETIVEYPDLKNEEFYRRLTTSRTLPVGHDPNILQFKRGYDRILSENPGATILSIHVSEALGTAISTARQAAAMLPMANIRLFDTRNVSSGQGLIVWEAARLAQAGKSADEILRHLAAIRDRTRLYIVVDTLEYLSKGGRVGPAARFVGGLLDVKPILTLKDGVVQAHSQHRTRSRALDELKQLVLAEGRNAKGLRMGVMHAMCPEDARQLAGELKQALQPEALAITEIGPAVGVNTGPGALGVTWFTPPSGAS